MGCYRPLYRVSEIAEILTLASSYQDTDFSELISIQVEQPLEELRLMNTIPCLKPIKDEISKLVRLQYEENPYPRWKTTDQVTPKSILEVIQDHFPSYLTQQSLSLFPEVLIAGCGTGKHAIDSARSLQNSQVLALDLSLTGLAYSKRKAIELGLNNIQWMQADILDLPQLTLFDVIECSGVLHHMHAPFEGWQILLSMLRPNGLMIISLYSELSRSDVIEARAMIKKHGYEANVEGIKECRQHIFQLPKDHPIKQLIQTIDFYTISGCRDLMFHVQEHRFNLLQISEAIKKMGLELIGIEVRDADTLKRYHSEFPDDPQAISLENWHQFEQRNPQTFIGMYHLWLKKCSP